MNLLWNSRASNVCRGCEPRLEIPHKALIDRPPIVQFAQIFIQCLYLGLGGIGLTQKLGLPVFKRFLLIGVLKALIHESEHKGTDYSETGHHPIPLVLELRKVQIRDALLNLCLRPFRSRLLPPRQCPRALTES